MAVQSMQLVYLSGAYDTLDELTQIVADSGCFQPETAQEILGNATGFTQINDENPYTQHLARIESIVKEFGLQSGHLKKHKKQVDDEYMESFLNKIESSIKDLHKRREELTVSLEKAKKFILQLEHFKDLDIDIDSLRSMEFVTAVFGRLPHRSTEKLKLYSEEPYAEFFVSSSDKEYDWGVYFKPRYDSKNIDRLFASLFFEPIEIPQYHTKPAEILPKLSQKCDDIQAEIDDIGKLLEKIVTDNKSALIKLYEQVSLQNAAFLLRNYAARYDDTYMLIGWVPKDRFMKFAAKLKNRLPDVNVKCDKPSKNITPPTKLKNNFFFRPFQYYVEIYGVPNYGEVDPTAFVAITYTLLYGIMFADVGQGIILAIIGFLMYKLKNMPIGKILVPCGVCGAIFGLIFGSVFGYEDVLDPLYHAVGFAEKPFDVMQNATTLLAISIGIGVTLVIISMIFNVFSKLKQRNWGAAFFGHNGVSGLVLYCSILVIALCMVAGIAIPTGIIAAIGIVLPLILIFLEHPLTSLLNGDGFSFGQGIGDYILENFFVLFEVLLSYFTNTLSFLRVGAFVLIHAGIMTAFFALAGIMGGGVASAIMVVFGNIFVIALEGLLVGIQVLRLEFYEMFSRFYDGDGKIFTPYKLG